MEPRRDDTPSSFHRRMLANRLGNPELRAEFERLHTEMVEQFAPAGEGPVVHPGLRRRGRLVFGDATE